MVRPSASDRMSTSPVVRRSTANDASDHAFWTDVANRTQTRVIEESKAVTLPQLGEELGEANEPTVAQQVASSPVNACREAQRGFVALWTGLVRVQVKTGTE